jgi:hypothetical protein
MSISVRGGGISAMDATTAGGKLEETTPYPDLEESVQKTVDDQAEEISLNSRGAIPMAISSSVRMEGQT